MTYECSMFPLPIKELEYLLMRFLAFIPLCESQILTHIIAISDLGDALMMQSQDVRTILLKM